MKVNFYFEEIPRFIAKQDLVRSFVKEMAVREKSECGDLNIIFCSDEYLLNMNREYLRHDYFTDIITFDNSGNGLINGELYISIDRVKDNAATYGVPYKHELIRVVIHGVLHLLGYGDKSPEEKLCMREKEDFYLKLFDIEKRY